MRKHVFAFILGICDSFLLINAGEGGRRILFSSHSRHTRGVKSSGRAEKKLNFGTNFKVPGSNLAWVALVVSLPLCFSTSRLSEIRRAGGTRILAENCLMLKHHFALFEVTCSRSKILCKVLVLYKMLRLRYING